MTSANEWRAKGYLVRHGDGKAPWADQVAALPTTIGIEQVRAVFAARPAPRVSVPRHTCVRPRYSCRSSSKPDKLGSSSFAGQTESAPTEAMSHSRAVCRSGETPLAGALREAYEEVGIRPADVEVIGRLEEFPATGSGFHITPIVGITATRPDYVINVAEIDRVFDVPLVELFDPACYREETWRAPGSPSADIPFFDLDGGTVWGATAVMLMELLAAVLEGAGD